MENKQLTAEEQTQAHPQLPECGTDNNHILMNVFASYQSFTSLLTPEQSALFLRLLPVIHAIRGDESKITETLSSMIGLPVRLQHVVKTVKCENLPGLGKAIMGETFVLGSGIKRHDMLVIVDEIPRKRIPEFIGEGKSRRILLELSDMLFPADMEVGIKPNVIRSEGAFILSDNPEIASRRGIDTYI